MDAKALAKIQQDIRDDILYGRLPSAEMRWHRAQNQGADLPPLDTMRAQVKEWATQESNRRQQMAMMPRPKNPGVAAVLSFLFAGLGQIYNGQIFKGIVFLVLYGISLAAIFVAIGLLTTPIMWLVGMVDAYQTAERINRDAVRQAFGPF